MDHKDIRNLAALMKEMELSYLEYAEGGVSVKMERAGIAVPMSTAQPQAVETAFDTEREGLNTVKSPMVGVFYAAPGADLKPYVTIGDTVRAGEVLCIIEAMKIMNEITAESDGVVAEICVTNRQIVEFGQPLFRLRDTEK